MARIPLKPLSGGVVLSRHPSLLLDGQASFAENVEFADESVRSVRGSRKLGNQTLLRPALACAPDPAYSPLYVEAGKSVPLRGYATWPYDEALDLGGDFAISGGAFPSEDFHTRRGRSFELQVSFRIPETFRMHERPARGESTPAVENAAIAAGCGYDEGLDDCTIIVQKGGDRLAPMSWALGIVGAGKHVYNVGLTDGDAMARRSNYFLVFMWLDSAEWGVADRTRMRYDLATFANNATGAYSTQALRAVILDGRDDEVNYALEPGRTYNVSLALALDTLPGGTTWAHDGGFIMRVQEEHGRFWEGSFLDSGAGGTTTNLSTWKGPTDSLRYLSKFGVRYSGRDAVHFGLGYRGAPWEALGWLPFGHDSSAMEHKGFRMADCSANSIADLYGGAGYNLTCTHPVAGNTYLSVDRALVDDGGGVGAWGRSPLGPRSVAWQGLGGNTGAGFVSTFNPQALRGYRVVFPRNATAPLDTLQGGCMNIESYTEVADGDYRLEVQDAENLGLTWATQEPFLVRAFRWNQQRIDLQEFRLWSSSRDYTNPRVKWSMTHSLELDDETEPELSKLQAYIPFSDAGGRVAKELVRGKHAYLAPFGLGLSKSGQEGENELFLSGEGDALVYDLSENPVFAREMKALLDSNSRGFAIELSCIIPEAHYGIATTDAAGLRSGEYEAAYCPDLVSWAAKDADEAGVDGGVMPLLTMGHHSWWQLATGTTPERRPQGFQVDVHTGLDSDSQVMTNAVRGFTRSFAGPGNWDDTAPWVGKRITIQVGVQPSPANRAGTPGSTAEFRVYIAATPKGALKYAAGEDPQSEFAYYADIAINKKHLSRLVVTIGGGWNPALARGFTEYGCRLIVDKVRVYGATAAGDLPSASGLVTALRRGKILGRQSLAQRELDASDILQPLGVGTHTATLTSGSTAVAAPGGTSFFTQDPEDALESVREKYLVPLADTFLLPSIDEFQEAIQEVYWIEDVAADGMSLSLATPYSGPTSKRGAAAVTNLVGYTTFASATEVELERSPLTLGGGDAYKPGTTKTKDIPLSPELFENRSPVDGSWRIRIASPFTDGGLAQVLPRWVRGIVSPRRGKVTGVAALDDAVFATTKGSIAKIDDRWREEGPTDALRRSLAFLGRGVAGFEARFPLAGDGVRFPRYENVWPYWSSAISRDFCWCYDFWIWLDEYAETQTLLWLGCDYSHLLLGPGSTDNLRGIGLWLRVSDGRPEVVRESAGNFAGGAAPPPDGRYVTTAADRIPLGRWTHLRFWLNHRQSGGLDVLRTPGISINGRLARSVVNARETGLADPDDWIQVWNGGGLIGALADSDTLRSRNTLLLGVARDSVRTLSKSQFALLSQLGGQEFPGGRISGLMHPLLGRMAQAVAWRAASGDALVSGFPSFDPRTLDYTGRLVRFRCDFGEGVGEHLDDAGTDVEAGFSATVPGVVLSHPAIDLYNEFGDTDQQPSFATLSQRLYATCGGPPAQVSEHAGGPAGIVPPSSAPTFHVEHSPLWEPNEDLIDPVEESDAGTGQPTNHLSSAGNGYLNQRFHEDLVWTKDDSLADTPFDILGVKFYWHPRAVTGRIPLWSRRSSLENGGLYLDCVDGKAELGWYDTALKERVSVATSAPVFRPGYWYYVYLRKAFPQQDEQEGNWLNSWVSSGRRRRAAFTITAGTWALGEIVRNGAATKRGIVTKVYAGRIEYMLFATDVDFVAAEAVNNGAGATGTIDSVPHHLTGDALVIREFSKTGTMLDTVPWGVTPSVRAAVSFTSEMPRSPNTTAIGQVTPKGVLFTGDAVGLIVVSAASSAFIFTTDMVGMYFQFSSLVANAPEKVYRIATVPGASTCTVVDENGNNPNLTAFVDRDGGVFAGIELVKSERFDESLAPDQGNYDVEFMGSGVAAVPSHAVAPMNGKFDSFAWGVASSLDSNAAFYSGFLLFEAVPPTELAEIGTDSFPFRIFDTGGRPGELHADGPDTASVFTAVHTQPYALAAAASTQPNEALEVKQEAEGSTNAESLYWRFNQEPLGASGRRLVYVAFYDRDQDVRSNPGPQLVVEVPEEDRTNRGGTTKLRLSNLPVSHQPGAIERHIFVTEADGLVPFRVLIVPDNRSVTCALDLDDSRLDYTDPIEYDNGPPPQCSVLATSQACLFYGDVLFGAFRQRDILFFSKPFLPVQVPALNHLLLTSGSNERITAMAEVGEVLLVWKKDALLAIAVRDGAAFQKSYSTNVGAASPQAVAVLDREAYWFSRDRGLYVFLGLDPVWLGSNLADLFEGIDPDVALDAREVERVSMAVNRRQNQVVAAFRALGEKEQRRRLSVEYDGALAGTGLPGVPAAGFRNALYAGPNVTALGAADRASAGPRRFLGGTAEGFVVELDRSGATLDVHEPGLSSTLTLGAGSTTTRLVLSAPVTDLLDLEGIRGVPVSIVDAAGVETRATALFCDGAGIHLDRALLAAPASGSTVTLGAIPLTWRSKWFDLGMDTERKIPEWLDIAMRPQASGQAALEAFVDYDESNPVSFVTDAGVVARHVLDLTQPFHTIPLGELRCRALMLQIRTVAPALGVELEILELNLSVAPAEPHS